MPRKFFYTRYTETFLVFYWKLLKYHGHSYNNYFLWATLKKITDIHYCISKLSEWHKILSVCTTYIRSINIHMWPSVGTFILSGTSAYIGWRKNTRLFWHPSSRTFYRIMFLLWLQCKINSMIKTQQVYMANMCVCSHLYHYTRELPTQLLVGLPTVMRAHVLDIS